MKKYTVVAPVTIGPGAVLDLSPQQAQARAHAVKDLGKGLYLVIQDVEFKTAEKIGYDGPEDKYLSQRLSVVPGPTKPAQ